MSHIFDDFISFLQDLNQFITLVEELSVPLLTYINVVLLHSSNYIQSLACSILPAGSSHLEEPFSFASSI